VEEHFGSKVVDPYRYMENFADPAVQAWVKGQADYAAKTLAAIPGREKLLERIRELDAGAPYRLHVVRRWANGDWHYLKTLASENLEKLYFKDGKTGAERLLVDPEKFAEPGSGKHSSLAFCVPSPDGRLVLYGVAASGSEQTTLRVLDAESGKDLPDVIDRMEADYTPPMWLPDGKSFVYSRRRALPAGAPARGLQAVGGVRASVGGGGGEGPGSICDGDVTGRGAERRRFPEPGGDGRFAVGGGQDQARGCERADAVRGAAGAGGARGRGVAEGLRRGGRGE
jgi:prolyl oligopeptidase